MQIRKERNHQYGHSNIDFRSKKDNQNIDLYQPWKSRKQIGTMGYGELRKTVDERKNFFKVTASVSKFKNLAKEVPDPKCYKTAEYYYKNNIAKKPKTFDQNERLANLDEKEIGKDVYIGDSMMIADIRRSRKSPLKSNEIIETTESQREKYDAIINDKTAKNKAAYQETQLVKIKAEDTLIDRVNIEKIKEIRLALRRRYASRTQFGKIFKQWDASANGEITLNDAHKMINNFGIPINYNETAALIGSSNKRDTATLNMEEFLHLIFSDNQALEIDLKKIKYQPEDKYKEGQDINKLKDTMKTYITEDAKLKELRFLKEYLRSRLPFLGKYYNEITNNGNPSTCNFKTFCKIINKFKIPSNYSSEHVLRKIYDDMKPNEDDNIDYRKFIDKIVDFKDENDFFNAKEKYIEKLENKIKNSQKIMQESADALRKEEEAKKLLAAEIEKDIANHEKYEKEKQKHNEDYKKEINNYQPSLEIVNKFFKDRDLYEKKVRDTFKSFVQDPNVSQKKTRYGGFTQNRNTFGVFQPAPDTGMYLSEKDRFNVRGRSEVEFVEKEKRDKELTHMGKIQRLKNINEEIEQNKKKTEFLKQEKEIYSLLQRTQKLYKYEQVNKFRNDLIE